MKTMASENLFAAIGDIDDFFLAEAETADIAKTVRRKRIAKYSVAGVAGLAVSVGIAVAYWKRNTGKMAKAA